MFGNKNLKESGVWANKLDLGNKKLVHFLDTDPERWRRRPAGWKIDLVRSGKNERHSYVHWVTRQNLNPGVHWQLLCFGRNLVLSFRHRSPTKLALESDQYA